MQFRENHRIFEVVRFISLCFPSVDHLSYRIMGFCERECASHGARILCPTICRYIVTDRVTLWYAGYSACVVYTKTIIHSSVGESG